MESKVTNETAKIRDFLVERYIEDPCATLSTAFWKILNPLNELKTDIIFESNEIKIIMLSDEKRLLLHWQPINEEINLKINLSLLNFYVIHERYKIEINPTQLTHIQKYFRLSRNFENIPENFLPSLFHIQCINVKNDFNQISSFLNVCYPDAQFSEDSILKWTCFPVFNPHFWIWIVNDDGFKVALGIADFDDSIKEISLEWIQVHPEFRNKGLGKALVYELLRRGIGKASFATVSGSLQNESNPEKLYRSCGFSGSDIWYVYSNPEME